MAGMADSAPAPAPQNHPENPHAGSERPDPAGLRIVYHPDPVLRRVAAPLAGVTDRVREVAGRMVELMHEARGVGLAAPQVGLSWRMFVANPANEPGRDRVFINPVLRDPTPQTTGHEEGCLSLPHVTAEVTRPVGVTIDALDEHGDAFTLSSEDFAARVWQHEFDHLEGVLILDKMTKMDRMANKRAIQELEKS